MSAGPHAFAEIKSRCQHLYFFFFWTHVHWPLSPLFFQQFKVTYATGLPIELARAYQYKSWDKRKRRMYAVLLSNWSQAVKIALNFVWTLRIVLLTVHDMNSSSESRELKITWLIEYRYRAFSIHRNYLNKNLRS